MENTLFVNLKESYPELSPSPSQASELLRNCTCGWWKIKRENIGDIKYLVGVYGGQAVSVYRVRKDKWADWPFIDYVTTAGSHLERRRYIPVHDVTQGEWQIAQQWNDFRMYGPTNYGTVHEDAQGNVTPVHPELKQKAID